MLLRVGSVCVALCSGVWLCCVVLRFGLVCVVRVLGCVCVCACVFGCVCVGVFM